MNILNIDMCVENIYYVDDIIKKIPDLTADNCLITIKEICTNIENKSDHKNLIIFAGDLYENNISPTKIWMFIEIITNLASITDIIVFKCNRDNKNISLLDDFLYPNLYGIKTKYALHILEKSGDYMYGNIIFKYIDVNDNIINNNKNNNEKIEILLCDEYKIKEKNIKGYDLIICSDINKTARDNKMSKMYNYLPLCLKNKKEKKDKIWAKNMRISL
jgi:hypothetical protein